MTDARALAALRHVVLVDDNDMDNRYHGIVLKKAGFSGRLSVYETGEDALQELLDPQDPANLVLLDINLPGMNGFEVATALDGAHRPPDLVVVMLTSSPDPGDVERAGTIPVVRDYVTKPLTVDALVEIVTRHLSSRDPGAGD